MYQPISTSSDISDLSTIRDTSISIDNIKLDESKDTVKLIDTNKEEEEEEGEEEKVEERKEKHNTNIGSSNTDEVKEEKNIDYLSILYKLLPLLWPLNLVTRLQIVFSIILLIISNTTSLIVPLFMKYIIDTLTTSQLPILYIILYGSFRFFSDFTLELRNIIYISISSTLEKNIASDLFKHLQALSLRYHLDRKTGSVIRTVSRGATSFAESGRIILFQFFPVILQVCIVCGYLLTKYDYLYGIVTFITITIYFIFTLITTEWRAKFRKIMNEKDNEYNQRAVDALLNFETVKYFCAEKHEQKRYENSLQDYRDASVNVQQSLSVLNLGQSFIISTGLMIIMALAAKQCVDGQMTIGDFVLVNQFMLQLYSPMEYLGSYYRALIKNFVDIESMFSIMEHEIEIEDAIYATDFVPKKGEIVFDNVSFTYENQYPILKNVSFKVEPGQRVAIVGPSGAGKSTIARLLYRFYDVQTGKILVDGQSIKDVKQHSLRSKIAIVPQDTVLFNDTIGYNIGYGSVSNEKVATENEIIQAANSASLNKLINSKNEGFKIKVGERGLRLSGGEKQRVGIARALLKRPLIFIFDEATSSLDTLTERDIQASIEKVSRGFTSITIAHRLSTVMNSDLILVLKNGKIVEKGTHNELLSLNGEYSLMWKRQEEAQALENEISRLQIKKDIGDSPLIEYLDESDGNFVIDIEDKSNFSDNKNSSSSSMSIEMTATSSKSSKLDLPSV